MNIATSSAPSSSSDREVSQEIELSALSTSDSLNNTSFSIDDSDDSDNSDDEEGVRDLHDRRPPSASASASASPSPFSNIPSSDSSLFARFHRWLYPPETPRSVQLFRLCNLAIPACYLLVGALQGFSGALMNVYPLDLGATEAQQTTVSALRSLPASFKLVYGFISDGRPLWGYKRKSYMFCGWCVAGVAMGMLLLEGTPSIPYLSMNYFLFGFGFWFADVMADSVVAEKAKLEPAGTRGSLQSTCYACRFGALMVAAPVSTVIYSEYGPKPVIAIMTVLPLAVMIPLIYFFEEEKNPKCNDVRGQCSEIWNTVCSRAVWQPMSFVYCYNVLQIGNAAWKQYLKTVLEFTSTQLNSLLIASYVLLYIGVMVYKYYFIKWSWRKVYIMATMLNGVVSILQIFLILQITFGLSNFLFALGDDAMAEFIAGIQFLPTTIMMVHLCPKGSEGASYAMFTTVNNSALNLAVALSTSLLGIWDVSKEAMENDDLSGFMKLTILTTGLQLSGILLVKLLPETKEDLMKLNYGHGSRIGGFIFLLVTGLSLLYSVVAGVLNIVDPGWMGESR